MYAAPRPRQLAGQFNITRMAQDTRRLLSEACSWGFAHIIDLPIIVSYTFVQETHARSAVVTENECARRRSRRDFERAVADQREGNEW